MKKFLIILMVLAMASVLFVGCTTPPTPTPTPTPTPDPATVSATPVLTDVQTSLAVSIFDVTSTATLYMNIAEVGASILVTGTAPSESLVRIYLDDVAVGPAVAEATVAGLWSVAIAKSSLGDDGVKVMTAKVTEVGLAESAASNAATFTLDTVRPSATTLAATAAAADGHDVTSSFIGDALITSASVRVAANLVAGTYSITCIADSAADYNITVAGGTMTTQTLKVTADGTLYVIPGVAFNTTAVLINAAGIGSVTTLTVTDTAAISSRAKVGFNEAITNASAILPANFTFSPVGGTVLSYATLYTYFSGGFAAAAVQGTTLTCTVDDVVDLAGNAQTTANIVSCTVGAASATSLAP